MQYFASLRAGIPKKVAMKISGHKTRAVFDRYNIVNEADLKKASEKVFELHQDINSNLEKVQKINNGHNMVAIAVLGEKEEQWASTASH